MKKVLILLGLFLAGCSGSNELKKELMTLDSSFAPYVAAYTSGEIRKNEEIRIKLQQTPGEFEQNIFHISPKVEGNLSLAEDARTLIFKPNENLKNGQVYEIGLDLDEIVPNIDNKFSSFSYQLKVIEQDFSLEIDGMEPYNSTDKIINKFSGTLFTADLLNSEELDQILKIKLKKESLKIQWESNNEGTKHKFVVDSIRREKEDMKLEVLVDGEPIDIDRNFEKSFLIPALDNYQILSVEKTSKIENFTSIRFSDALMNQDLNGLIRFKDDLPAIRQMEVYLNEIRIYTDDGIAGTFELIIDRGVKNFEDKELSGEFRKELTFESSLPQINLLGNGNIIPKSNQLLFPFETIGLKGVNVQIYKIYEDNILQFFQQNDIDGNYNLREVASPVFDKDIIFNETGNVNLNHKNKFSLDLAAFIEPEPGAIYKVQLNIAPHLSNMACFEKTTKQTQMVMSKPNEDWSVYESEDYYDDYFYPEGYDWSKRDDPCDVSYYTSEKSQSRNILASNFGIIAKISGEKELDVSVSNLLDTKPMDGVNIKVYNYQRRLIGDGKTDSDGFYKLKLKEKPFILIADKNNEKGYLKLGEGNSINMSRFPIDGVIPEDGLKGFIYGERGVWRPGDSIYVTCVLQNNLKEIPNNYPLRLEFYSPDNQLYEQTVRANGQNGFYVFKLKTPENAKTGRWYVKAVAGNFEFYKNINIETIKPNKLKINLDFENKELSNKANTANLKVAWLNGSKASDLRTNVTASFFPQETSFSKYPNFIFDDPTKDFKQEELVVFDGKINSNGTASFPLNMKLSQLPSGKLKVGLFTKVFEKGGDFSTNYSSIEYSPYSSYVGFHIDYSSKMLETGKKHKITVLNVNSSGQALNNKEIKVSLYRLKSRWWYSQEDEQVEFMSSEYSTHISTETLTTVNGKATYAIKVENDDWGKYFLRIEDSESGHSAAQLLSIDWPNWRSRGNIGEDASILAFKTDKEIYQVGETAEIVIPTHEEGRILLSIENGTAILEKRWIKTEAGQTKIKIKIKPEMRPNVYASISLIQPHYQTANDLPIRMFGVTPIMVNDQNSHLNPVISAPKSVEPQKNFSITVKEKMGKEMTYTLAIVDEGLLDITSFKTPNIWNHFNQKEALGIKTWDLYQSVLGAFNGKFANIYAIGGGDEAVQALDKGKVNRFKPVVKYLGPFTLGKNGSKNHKINLPNYLGSVKIMVVAGNQKNQFGQADQNLLVRKPLMLTATLPRVLSPGENINVPITIFAEPNIKQATVTFSTNKLLQSDNKSYVVILNKNAETILNIPLKVNEELGTGQVKVTVKSGSFSSYEEIEIPIRLPNPLITKKADKILESGKSESFQFEPFGILGASKIELQVSTAPPINLSKRINYLISYPHGCVEQISSTGLGQLFLGNLIELSTKEQSEIEQNIKAAIARLKSFQMSNGGLGYWPNAQITDDWGSSYAGHFLIEAEKKGYALPTGLKTNWIKYQSLRADQWNATASERWVSLEEHQLAQAYRLFTLALASKANLGAMNRLRNTENLGALAANRLAATYAMLGKRDIARELLKTKESSKNSYYSSYTYGSEERDLAMKLETYTLLKDNALASVVLKSLSAKLNTDKWLSTHSTAFSLMAIAKFLGDKPSKNLNFEYTLNGKKQVYNSSKVSSTGLELPLKKGTVSITNTSGAKLFVSLVNSGIPVRDHVEPQQKNLNMQIVYRDMENKVLNVSNLTQGTDFKAVVTISNSNTIGDYSNLALSQLFPSGWEIINQRMNEGTTLTQSDAATYQDIRDDRVYTYFDLKKSQSKTFVVLLNAAYKGSYILPAVQCQAMYNDDVKAIVAGGRASVD
jgi:uncharacterized protein YfaS (alpha-2-macroglobulin family)